MVILRLCFVCSCLYTGSLFSVFSVCDIPFMVHYIFLSMNIITGVLLAPVVQINGWIIESYRFEDENDYEYEI